MIISCCPVLSPSRLIISPLPTITLLGRKFIRICLTKCSLTEPRLLECCNLTVMFIPRLHQILSFLTIFQKVKFCFLCHYQFSLCCPFNFRHFYLIIKFIRNLELQIQRIYTMSGNLLISYSLGFNSAKTQQSRFARPQRRKYPAPVGVQWCWTLCKAYLPDRAVLQPRPDPKLSATLPVPSL